MVEDPEQVLPGKPLPHSTAQGGHSFTSASRSAGIRSDSLPVGAVKRMRGADLKKRFRWDEFLSEKIITVVAFASLAAILSIFVFVFREAMPIFLAPSIDATVAAPAEAQETYGSEQIGDAARRVSGSDRSRTAEGSGGEGESTLANFLGTTTGLFAQGFSLLHIPEKS